MGDKKYTTKRMQRYGRWFAWTLGLGLSVTIALALSLTSKVISDLERQRSASSDNVQWTLTQVEVEYLTFLNALEHELNLSVGRVPGSSDLEEVRRQFDVFYSRVDTLRNSKIFQPLRGDPSFEEPLGAVYAFLDRTVPIIDSGDDILEVQIAPIWNDGRTIRDAVRQLSLEGLSHFAVTADARRSDTASTLAQLAVLSVALLLVLALVSVYLMYVNRIIRRRGRELVETNQRMNTILSTSLDGVIVSNAQGHVLEFNPAAEVIFGYSAEEARGASIGSLIVPPHLREKHDAGMLRMQRGGARHVVGKGRVQLEAMRKGGDVFPVELALQSAKDGEEDIVIGFIRDVSEQVAAEAELISARDRALAGEKAKANFLTVMSHEIRTPLNGLLGNLSLLKNAHPSREQRRFIDNMEISGQVLLNHVDTVLDIARFEAGKLAIKREPIDLGQLLQEIVDGQSGNAASRGNVIEWQWIGEGSTWVKTDTQRLRHILLNLVGNAIKFTENGRISIEADVAERSATSGKAIYEFRVIDSGVGIADEDQERIFEDFYTQDASIGRTTDGTGLGLGITRRFAEAMGGEVGVESELGAGSVFWVRLPMTEAGAPKQVTHDPAPREVLPRLDLLVVEDNDINLEVIRNMLEMDGHRVTVARDGKSGVTAANKHLFDAILMDISMPVMDGPTATRHIRNGAGKSAGVPIIAVSANVLPEAVDGFREAGMDAFIGKPLRLSALRSALAALSEVTPLTGEEEEPDPLSAMRDTMGDAAVAKLLRKFLDEGEAILARLGRVGPGADLPAVAAECHKLAGSAAMFGATELRDVLVGTEVAAKSGAVTEVSAKAEQAKAVWAATKQRLPDIS
ncbi:ATP-binding protein [Lutimaribacter marinistellae]|uniref:histidine kinase n=1 Tax=Lutimaribacter marinistellae TaxID=1820329 RepID=A0ABV7TG04_9RHOB